MNKKTNSSCLSASTSIDLVIFDCDGVLVDSEIISVDVLLAELKAIGVETSIDYFHQHFLGRSFSQVRKVIFDDFKVELAEDFETTYQQRLLQAFETRLQTTDGIRGVLEKLGTAYCVATSSSPQRTKKALELTGLSDLFSNNVFTASQVKKGKPAPDLFLFAAQQMGVKPEHCLVIEDSQAGLVAAQAAGMRVWQYIGGSHFSSTEQKPAQLCPSITRFSSWQNFYKMATNIKQAS